MAAHFEAVLMREAQRKVAPPRFVDGPKDLPQNLKKAAPVSVPTPFSL